MSDASAVLRTINRYAEEGRGNRQLEALTIEIGRDRRFTSLLVLSLIAHSLFFGVIFRIDWLLLRSPFSRTATSGPLVKITELAPPPERLSLRTKPEPIERVDIKRLQFNPNDANDERLLSRSPKPSEQKGNAGSLPSAEVIERRLRELTRARRAGSPPAGSDAARATQRPPELAQVQTSPDARSEPAPFDNAPPGRGNSPAPTPAAPSPVAKGAHDSPAGSRTSSASESNALGLSNAQGNYIAYVRAKITRINEANMPRKWIEDVLRDKVSAQFSLMVMRDGRVTGLQLWRTSGYAVLDARAREAILLASPFEGYPPTAGDSLQFTVTVYYTPYR